MLDSRRSDRRHGSGLPSAARWMRVAAAHIGALEDVRRQHGQAAVERYLRESGFAVDRGDPWCTVYVRWVMEQVGFPASTQRDTPSWLGWGERSPARYGCLAVLADSDAEGPGHVGFYVGESTHSVYLLGANTWTRGRYAPAIGIRAFHKSRVLGYRWPSEARLTRMRRGVSGFRLPAPGSALSEKSAELRRRSERLREQLAQACAEAPQALRGVLRQRV